MSRFAKGRPKVLRAGQIGLILELECICDENAAYAFTDDTAGILLFYGKVCALEQKRALPQWKSIKESSCGHDFPLCDSRRLNFLLEN